MESALTDCPKCAAPLAPPLPRSAACPQCGVYFFKLDAGQPSDAPPPITYVEAAPKRGVMPLVLAVSALGLVAALAIGQFWPVTAGSASKVAHTDESSNDDVPVSALPHSGGSAAKVAAMAAAQPTRQIPPHIKALIELYNTPEVVFDMRDEVYRIANLNDITINSIYFADQAKPSEGATYGLAAMAQVSLRGVERGFERVCDVRVMRAQDDVSYQPGAPTTALTNLVRRATIAHELSHCIDWYRERDSYQSLRAQLPPAPDALTEHDRERRWREEFADVHSFALLRRAYGDETARLALIAQTEDRREHPHLWYRHAFVALNSGESLSVTTPDESYALVVKYWGTPVP
jgi:hypothetical protein